MGSKGGTGEAGGWEGKGGRVGEAKLISQGGLPTSPPGVSGDLEKKRGKGSSLG